MRRSPIPSLILCLILALLLLFPCTPYGQRVIRYYFPSVNFNEEALLSSGPGSPEPETPPPEQEQTDYSYYTVLREELSGSYLLVSLFTPGEEISAETLAGIHRLGIPLSLTLQEDGSAELLIFDQKTQLQVDLDRMLITAEGLRLPFFYQNGKLTVQEDRSYLVFEKQP